MRMFYRTILSLLVISISLPNHSAHSVVNEEEYRASGRIVPAHFDTPTSEVTDVEAGTQRAVPDNVVCDWVSDHLCLTFGSVFGLAFVGVFAYVGYRVSQNS